MPERQGNAGPAFETPGAQVPGKWEFNYSIIPHKGDWHESFQQAFAFQTNLQAIETGIHPGEISVQGSFISSSPTEFVISAVKAAENGKGWLVRGFNISSEPIQVSLKPYRRFTDVTQVNLAEEKIALLDNEEDGSVTFSIGGHQIIGIIFSD